MKAKPKIVLVVNAPDRDERINQKIQSAIMRINPDAQVQILERCDPDMVTKTLEINPDVIMCAPITAQATSPQFYILKYLLNCPLVCFRTEGILNVNSQSQFREMAGMENYGVNLVDYEIFWGRKTACEVGKILVAQNKLSSLDRTKYFGAPSFEDYFQQGNELDKTLPNHIKATLEQYPKEKTILFVTGFHLADYSPQDVIKAGDLVDRKSQTAEEDFEKVQVVVEKIKRFRQMWIDAVISSALNNPGLLFVVKTHPIENIHYGIKKVRPYAAFSDYDNILLLTENMPFRAIIHHCSLLFHYGSTTMLEAYLPQVPSVYVNSGELRLGSDKLYELNDLGIPSTLSVDVVDVPSIVSQHAAAPIKLKRQREVEQYLEDILELKIGCDYRASNRIADFLLSAVDEAPQHISSDDKYLAQIIHQSGPALIDMLFNKGLSKTEVNDFKGALFYFDKAPLVAETGQFQVKKLQYLRSYCLYKMGLIDEAVSAIQQELAVNPDDSQVQKLHRQLQSALRGKTTMVVPHTRKEDYNCSPTMITTDSYGLSNNIEQQTSENASYGRRLIPHYDVSDGQKCLERARKSFKNGNFNEAFDIYEQLSIAYPASAIEILAEVYDQYQRLPNRDKYSLYQSRFFNFGINPTDKVLDIGSGNIPFQVATHLADIAINDNDYGRAGVAFKYLDGKSVFECNIENMPFGDKEFDFVSCSHVLEHVHNPQKACDELMRIGKRGYIETPTRAKDLWLNNAKVSNHRWSVECAHDRLIFTEYAKDQIEGLGSDILSSMHCAPQSIREKAFSALIYLKAHLFNTMLLWEGSFRYEVRRLNHSQTNVSEDVPVIVEG